MKALFTSIISSFILISSVILSLLIGDMVLGFWNVNFVGQFALFLIAIITAAVSAVLAEQTGPRSLASVSVFLMTLGTIVLSGLVILQVLGLL